MELAHTDIAHLANKVTHKDFGAMNLVLRQRHPSEGFTCLASGNFLFDCPETLCVVAAASCSVHLFGIETLGVEEFIVPIASLDVYGHIAQIACLTQSHADLALVLLKTGELKVLRCQNGRLQVLDSIQIFQELTEDYALFLSVFDNGIVAVGSRFGRIGFLHFPVDAILWQHSLPTSSIHSAPQCIDLLQEKDKRGNTIMPRGSERLVSLDLAVVPLDWPLPTENTLRKKFQVTLWVGIEIVSGSIANTTQGYTCLLGWTRVAAVSFPDPYLPTYTDPCTALPSALLLHWYEGNLPNRSRPTPASQPHGPAFFSVAKSGDFSKYPEEHSQDRFFYRYSTAAECREKDCIIGPSYDSVDHNALRPLHLSWLEDSEIISSWYWELENKFPGEDYFLVIATTAGRLYRVSLAYLRYNHVEELEKGEDDTQITRDNFMYRDATKLNACLPVFLHACGTVEGEIVAMTSLPGSRVVCITDDHAVVLLRLDESTPALTPPLADDVPDGLYVSHVFNFSLVHCYQGAGSLVSCEKYHLGGVVMAVRGGSFERLKEYSEAWRPLDAPDEEPKGGYNVSMDFDQDKKGNREEEKMPEITKEEAATAEEHKDEEIYNKKEDAAAALGEDISVGGATTYGAPGALVTIHADTLLEKMFEGKAGEVLGATGLWPLKRSPDDKHHAAVLLASTTNARVLVVDGGGVFSDVTDSLQMVLDEETLAAGSMHISNWVAQVTPTHVRAFRLDPTFAAFLDWHPPAGTTITSSVVSNGCIILQCLSNAQHSLLVLRLQGNDTAVEFMQLGEFFRLSQEASCIGNLILVSTNSHAVLTIGTYRPSIMILELSIINVVYYEKPDQAWRVLGEMSLTGRTISDDDDISGNVPASSPPPPLSDPYLARVRPEKDIQYAEFLQMADWDLTSMEWLPGSPLAQAVRDHREFHPHRKTTGTTVPSSIVVSPVAGINDLNTHGIEIWVSSRNGDVHRLQTGGLISLGKEGVAFQNNGAYISNCSVPYGDLPPALALLPELKRVSPSFKVLAVSDRASLLRASPNRGAIDELRLHTPGVSCAAPLVLEVPDGGDRLFLFSASTDGALSLSSLEAHQRSKVIARPLPWRPDLIANNERLHGDGVPGVVAIAGRKWHHHTSEDGRKEPLFSLPYVELFDSCTGQRLNNFDHIVLIPGETITGLALVPSNFWEKVRESLIQTVTEYANQNLATNAGADQRYRCFILASSILDNTQRHHKPGDAQGRLLFFACPLHAGEPLQLLEMLYFPDPVYAVEFSDYTNTNLYRAIAVIATGRRIASYSVNLDPSIGGYLVKDASLSINSPAKALKIDSRSNTCDFFGKRIYAACVDGELNLLLYYAALKQVPGSVYAAFKVKSFPSEVFNCIDARFYPEEEARNNRWFNNISLDSSGIIRANLSQSEQLVSQGQCGDANPLGWAEVLNLSNLQDRNMLAITRGGGVVEVDLKLHRKFLLALQRAIVNCPDFKIETASVKKFLGLDRRPEIYKHPRPLKDNIKVDQGPERMATTAEGPPPAVIIAEPVLEEFLLSLEDFNRVENVTYNSREPHEMLHLSVLRLFLDSRSELQRELLLTAIKNVSGRSVQDDEINALKPKLVYTLSDFGAHSMF